MNEKPPLVLYHANCPDGFCAAWVCRLSMPQCECVPVQYGQEPPDVTDRNVYIVDFSYKRPVMRRILSLAHKVTVLDHHKTAQAELAGIVDEFMLRPDLIANPFGAAWFVRSDGKRQWSLRSRDGGIDVAEVARAHGGGGHRNAAGFEESV